MICHQVLYRGNSVVFVGRLPGRPILIARDHLEVVKLIMAGKKEASLVFSCHLLPSPRRVIILQRGSTESHTPNLLFLPGMDMQAASSTDDWSADHAVFNSEPNALPPLPSPSCRFPYSPSYVGVSVYLSFVRTILTPLSPLNPPRSPEPL